MQQQQQQSPCKYLDRLTAPSRAPIRRVSVWSNESPMRRTGRRSPVRSVTRAMIAGSTSDQTEAEKIHSSYNIETNHETSHLPRVLQRFWMVIDYNA
jgi:hypothetical protein